MQGLENDKKKLAIVFAVLLAALFAAYAPALGGDFIWDDDHYIVDNDTLRPPPPNARLRDGTPAPFYHGLVRMWTEPKSIPQWYPLVHTTFWVEYQMWGLNPVGYHVVNLLLHFGSTLLLFFILRRMRLAGALAAAAIFALHPVMVESVAWITERKNVLSLLLALTSLSFWLRFAPLDRGVGEKPRYGLYAWAFVFFVLALLSKTVTCSLPAAILLLIWWKRGRVSGLEVGLLVPFLVVGLVLALNTANLEKTLVGAEGEEWELSVAGKILVAGRALCFYTGKLVWPDPLVFIYERWNIDPGQMWQWAYPLAWVALGALLLLTIRRFGRGPTVAVLIFSGTLVPALGFFAVYPHRYAYVADHFQYHASIAMIVLLTSALATRLPRQAGLGLLGVVLVAFGVRTHFQCYKYDGLEKSYRAILDDVPDSWFALNNLAAILVQQDKIEEGLRGFRRAKELRPLLDGRHISVEGYAQIHVGCALVDSSRLTNRGVSKEQRMQRIRLAIPYLRRGLKTDPDYVLGLTNLGASLAQLAGTDVSKYAEPERLLRRAYDLGKDQKAHRFDVRKNLRQVYHNKAVLLGRAQRHGEAQTYQMEAQRLVQELLAMEKE